MKHEHFIKQGLCFLALYQAMSCAYAGTEALTQTHSTTTKQESITKGKTAVKHSAAPGAWNTGPLVANGPELVLIPNGAKNSIEFKNTGTETISVKVNLVYPTGTNKDTDITYTLEKNAKAVVETPVLLAENDILTVTVDPAEPDPKKSAEEIQKNSPYLTLAKSTNGTGDVPCNTTEVATGELKPVEIQIIDADSKAETVLQTIPLYFFTYGCIWKDGYIYGIPDNRNDEGSIDPGKGSAAGLRMISLTDAMTEYGEEAPTTKTQAEAISYCIDNGGFLPSGFDFVGKQKALNQCGSPGYDNIKDNLPDLLSEQCKASNPDPSNTTNTTCLSGHYWSSTTAPQPNTEGCLGSKDEGYSINFVDSTSFTLIWESQSTKRKVRCASSYDAPDPF